MEQGRLCHQGADPWDAAHSPGPLVPMGVPGAQYLLDGCVHGKTDGLMDGDMDAWMGGKYWSEVLVLGLVLWWIG